MIQTPNRPAAVSGTKIVRTDLSALTRVTWSGHVLIGPGVSIRDLTGAVYEHVDGGDYVEDETFWQRGEACRSLAVRKTEGHPVLLVAYNDEDGALVVRDVPAGVDPEVFLAQVSAGQPGEFAWPRPQTILGWPVFDVTLKGWSRVLTYADAHVPPGAEAQADNLVKWVVAPSEAVLAKWLADNKLITYLDAKIENVTDPLSARAVGPDDGLDLALDDDGDVIGGDPNAAAKWKAEAAALGRRLLACGAAPYFRNVYRCPVCGDAWEHEDEGQPTDACDCGASNIEPTRSRPVAGFVTK